jgi:hypothetical protein
MKTNYFKYFNTLRYRFFCLLFLGLNLMSCSQLETNNQKPATSPDNSPQNPSPGRLTPNDWGNALPGEGSGKSCTDMAKAGLNVDVLFAPGIPTSGKVKFTNDTISEDHTIGESHLGMRSAGLRMKGSDGKIRPWMSSSISGAVEKTGTFQVSVETLGQVFKKDNIVVQKDECHVIPQIVTFEITSPTQTRLDDTKDYYPLDNGALFELDTKAGSGKIVGQSTIYTEIEVVRVLLYTETSGSGPGSSVSAGSREEKTLPGKVRLGTFTEKGIDRGALPADAARDDGGRVLYGKR